MTDEQPGTGWPAPSVGATSLIGPSAPVSSDDVEQAVEELQEQDFGQGPATTAVIASALGPVPPDRAGDVASNMLTTVIGNFFPPLAMLITAPVLAHALGVVGRGEVAAATAPLVLVLTAATFGIPQAVTFVIARSPASASRATRVGLGLMVVAGLGATAAVITAASWLSGGQQSVAQLITLSSLAIVPSLAVAVLQGVAAGLHRWRAVARERLFSALARVAFLLPLTFTGHLNPFTATLVLSVGPLIGATAYIRALHAPEASRDGGPVQVRTMLSYGLRVWIGAISGILLSRLDQTLMNPLAGSYELGLYVVAATVADIPLIINSAVRDVTFSADAARATVERLTQSARISSSACVVLGAVVLAPIAVWLPLLFGEEFSPAIPVSILLVIATVQGTPGSIAGAGLAARGRPGLRSATLVVACIVNLVLLVLLVPEHGAMGAAWATLAGSFVAANSNVILIWRYFGVSPLLFYGLRRRDIATVVQFTRKRLARTS